ncbi:hypothetical protein FAM09_22590 [Niastella caeni]|uniref:Uncharacterized protein n=1 Tax=Niastella caeni TaxID=2569763 RepID=A0A4S8HKC8_9BACT|nr:hypothetical protein FAM09_22590 [Niastella caeni]
MNCLKPDHPCLVYTYPASVHIAGFGKTTFDYPSIQSVSTAFIPVTSIHDPVCGSGRRFDIIIYKGLG